MLVYIGHFKLAIVNKKIVQILVGAAMVALFLTGCKSASDKPVINGVTKQVYSFKVPGIDEIKTGELEIYRINQAKLAAEIVNQPEAPKRVSEWQTALDSQIVINGGYHHEDFSPSGYVKTLADTWDQRQFDLDLSGFVVVNEGRIDVVDPLVTSYTITDQPQALQSYPFLIKHGQPAIKEDSGLKARRTAIGIDQEGQIYVIIVRSNYLSLYQLMEQLVATGIEFRNVLNLDGGPSTGIAATNEQELIDSWLPVPSVISWDLR